MRDTFVSEKYMIIIKSKVKKINKTENRLITETNV